MVFYRQKEASKQRKSRVDSTVTILTSGCHFSGKLFCRGTTRIGSKIEGEIVSEGLLIIEEEALINADIQADEVIVQGVVKGSLSAKKRVELASTVRFDGDITAAALVINEGAVFNGSMSMGKQASEQTDQTLPILDKFQKRSTVNKIQPVADLSPCTEKSL